MVVIEVLEVAGTGLHLGGRDLALVAAEVVWLGALVGEVEILTAQNQDPEVSLDLGLPIQGRDLLRGHDRGHLIGLDAAEVDVGGARVTAVTVPEVTVGAGAGVAAKAGNILGVGVGVEIVGMEGAAMAGDDKHVGY